jgi:hypothetical protein
MRGVAELHKHQGSTKLTQKSKSQKRIYEINPKAQVVIVVYVALLSTRIDDFQSLSKSAICGD